MAGSNLIANYAHHVSCSRSGEISLDNVNAKKDGQTVAASSAPQEAKRAMAKLDEAEMDYTQALELMTEAADSGDRWVMLLNRGATRLALGKDDAGALADLNAAVAARGADAAVVLPSRASAFER